MLALLLLYDATWVIITEIELLAVITGLVLLWRSECGECAELVNVFSAIIDQDAVADALFRNPSLLTHASELLCFFGCD